MTTDNTGSGGVRNLRAIFENKASDLSTSPPSRGRSPAGSISSATGRPLSKVRTSFVSVERAGDIGTPGQVSYRKNTMESTNGIGAGLGSILKGSPFEPTEAEQSTGLERAAPKSTAQADSTTKSTSNRIVDRAGAMAKKIQSDQKSVPAKLQTNSNSSNAKPADAKASPVSQVKKSPITPTTNGPVVKPRGGVAKIQGVIKSAEEAREARAAMAAAPAKSTAADNKESSKDKVTSPRAAKAPRQSLPTRNTRLPGAATAPTAASAAKTDASSTAESNPVEKKSTVVRGAPRVANANTASSLAKKTSRASLGPNVNTTTSDRPKSRVSAARPAADEGFLARMTRPTASTAQKAQTKVEASSPPRPTRRNVAPPSTAVNNAHKKAPRKSLSTGTSDKLTTESKETVDGAAENSAIASSAAPVEQAPDAESVEPEAPILETQAPPEPKGEQPQQAEVVAAANA